MNIFKKTKRLVYYQKVLIYTFSTKEYDKSFQAKTPVWIGHASLDEIKELNHNHEMDLKVYQWQFLKEKIENGTWKYIVAKSEKKIVGYAFYSTNEMSFAGTKTIEFDLPPHAGYIFRNFVHPKFRNLSVGKQLAGIQIRALNKCGAGIAFGAVNSTNKVQLHNYNKMGGTAVGSVTFIKTSFFDTAFISKSIYKTGLKLRRIYT